MLFAGTAFATGAADSIVAQLRDQGFSSISVERTLLGRTRIVALSEQYRREIIFNPRTGEILRDFWQVIGTASGGGNGVRLINPSGEGGGAGEDDGGDDNDDDGGNDDGGGGDDDDDDEEDDEDDSGPD